MPRKNFLLLLTWIVGLLTGFAAVEWIFPLHNTLVSMATGFISMGFCLFVLLPLIDRRW